MGISEKKSHARMKFKSAWEEIERIEKQTGPNHGQRPDKFCEECSNHHRQKPAIYNIDEVHHLDGDNTNKSRGNTAIVCPRCECHIVLSPFTPKDIWGLKGKGMNNAEIGRLLGISRERVRQLCKRYQPEPGHPYNVDSLVKQAQRIEGTQKKRGLLKRRTDKRTLRKRADKALSKFREEEVKNDGKH